MDETYLILLIQRPEKYIDLHGNLLFPRSNEHVFYRNHFRLIEGNFEQGNAYFIESFQRIKENRCSRLSRRCKYVNLSAIVSAAINFTFYEGRRRCTCACFEITIKIVRVRVQSVQLIHIFSFCYIYVVISQNKT